MHIKYILLIPFLLAAQTLSAQTFSSSMGNTFIDVDKSSVAFSDVDGDNDQDVLLTGANIDGYSISKMYINDGQGNFSLVAGGSSFENVSNGSIAFADIDGDNDQDALVTGKNSLNDFVSKLYTNNGQGNFSEVSGTPFDGVRRSSIAFADVDGDNDQDLLLTGDNGVDDHISKLYINDGQGNFSEVTGTPFEGVSFGSIDFADVEGDNDQDVLITGYNGSDHISKLYINDGQGNFSELTGTSFEGIVNSSIAFADIDGDNDQDVLLAGRDSSQNPISKLYKNDGQGNFNEVEGTPFLGVQESSIAIADVNGDNEQDILITGDTAYTGSTHSPISKLYINDGQGNFNEVAGDPFEGVKLSSIDFADVDGDNDQDVLITGLDSSFSALSKLYINDGQGNFNTVTGTPFDNVAANLSTKSDDVLPYPNPIKGKHLHVKYNAPENGDVQVKVYGISGHLVKKQNKFAKRGQQSLSIELPSLAQGNYLLELQQGKQKGYAKFTVH